MRAYGLPRNDDVAHPDQGDIGYYGLSSKHGKQKSKSKRRARRKWKKMERRKAKKTLRKEQNDTRQS